MNPSPDLQSIITALRSDTGGGAIIRRRVDPSSPVDVYLGVEPATGNLGVLLGVHRRLVPAARDLPGGAGFALKPHLIKDDGRDTINLGIFCTDVACEDVFRHFMEDIVPRLLAESSPESALRAFLTRVSLWQRFFVHGHDAHLSEESRVGLFGELLLLRDVLIPAAGQSAAVDGWKGPEGMPQDFVVDSGALEVKCTRAKAGERIPVSNELQLDERPFAHLILAHVLVTQGGAGSFSLTDMVESVRGLLAGPALLAFNDRLITAGYLDAHGDFYRESRFSVREVNFYEVRDDFPRLRADDVPQGVAEISYKIDVSAVQPFKVDKSVVEARFRT
jgi:hypothetical protein